MPTDHPSSTIRWTWPVRLVHPTRMRSGVAGLTYLSPNTVKPDIRTIYRKIDVAGRNAGRAVVCEQRIQSRSPPNRTWARRSLTSGPQQRSSVVPGGCLLQY